MENTKVLKAMVKFFDENEIKWEKENCYGSYFTAKEWSEILEMKVTSSRLTSMYKAGLVKRIKDKQYFKDDVYHYLPCMRPIFNSWD